MQRERRWPFGCMVESFKSVRFIWKRRFNQKDYIYVAKGGGIQYIVKWLLVDASYLASGSKSWSLIMLLPFSLWFVTIIMSFLAFFIMYFLVILFFTSYYAVMMHGHILNVGTHVL